MSTSFSSTDFLQQTLPVSVVSTAIEPVMLSPGSLQSPRFWEELLSLVQEQGVVPIISPNRYLEGMLIENHLLSNQVLTPAPESADTGILNRRELLHEARRYQITLNVQQTLQDAQILLHKTNLPYIPIVDQDGRYTGVCASRNLLTQLISGRSRPVRVGGLATPLGVYLTTGVYSAGAGWLGLALTGGLFALLLHALDALYAVFYSALYAILPIRFTTGSLVSELATLTLQYGFSLMTLLLLVRWTPISGLHGAEHMTVHAIENGLTLNVENVSTQNRVHARCGTNLMVLLMGVQLAIAYLWILHPHITLWGELLFIGLWTVALMRWSGPVGHWIQKHFTTKQPTPPQLENAIQAGSALLTQFRQNPHGTPGFFQRLWGAGFLQILASFWLIHSLLEWLFSFLGKTPLL